MTQTIERQRTKIMLPNGDVFNEEMKPRQQTMAHLKALHADSEGLVEIAAGRREERLRIFTREDPAYFLPAGGDGGQFWLEDLMQLVDRHSLAGDELFVGPTPRTYAQGTRDAVDESRWLWVDIDNPDKLDNLREFIKERPCHLLVHTGGSGGVHAYWRLNKPLKCEQVHGEEKIDWLDRAHRRIIWSLGVDESGKPNVADPVARDRSRILRLAGTVNNKTGKTAQLTWADLRPDSRWDISDLVGDLPDPAAWAPKPAKRRAPRAGDEWQSIPALDYWRALTGQEPNPHGLSHCPSPDHPDRHPSCKVGGGSSPEAWICHSCGAAGGLVQLASVVNGEGWERVRGDAFKRNLNWALERLGLPAQ